MAMSKTQLARFVYKLFSETLLEEMSEQGSRYACRNVKIEGDQDKIIEFLDFLETEINNNCKLYRVSIDSYADNIYEFVIGEAEFEFPSVPTIEGDDDSLFVSEAEELDE